MATGRHSYVPFYPSDWLGGTARMSRLHRSVYFDICCYIWDHAKPCPPTELRLMLSDLPDWQAMVDDLVASGKLVRHEDGSVENPRAIFEAMKSYELTMRKSAGGSAAAKKAKSRKSAGGSADKTDGIEPEPEPEPEDTLTGIKPRKKRVVKPTEHFEPPEGVSEETWNAFLDVRKHHKAPLTRKAYELILKAIGESPGTPEDTVAASVMNNWRGVFPLKNGGNASGKRSGWLPRR